MHVVCFPVCLSLIVTDAPISSCPSVQDRSRNQQMGATMVNPFPTRPGVSLWQLVPGREVQLWNGILCHQFTDEGTERNREETYLPQVSQLRSGRMGTKGTCPLPLCSVSGRHMCELKDTWNQYRTDVFGTQDFNSHTFTVPMRPWL
jgi:hypothetical protein